MKAIHVVRSFNYEQEKSKRRPFARHVYDRAESCLSRELLCHYDVFPMTTAHRSLWFTNLLRTNNILRLVSLPRLPWPASFLSNADLFSEKLISQENSCGRSRSYPLCDSFTQGMQISELVESFGWKFEDPTNGCVEGWECYKREWEMKGVSTQVSRLNYTRMCKCEIEFKSKAFSPSARVPMIDSSSIYSSSAIICRWKWPIRLCRFRLEGIVLFSDLR